jgi:hypothetical protein
LRDRLSQFTQWSYWAAIPGFDPTGPPFMPLE